METTGLKEVKLLVLRILEISLLDFEAIDDSEYEGRWRGLFESSADISALILGMDQVARSMVG